MNRFSHLTARLLSLPIKFYRGAISPHLPAACRYTPTCSEYTLDALRLHGPVRGSVMAAKRILRCNPWGGAGYDPVPVPAHLSSSFYSPKGEESHTSTIIDVHHHGHPSGQSILSLTTQEYIAQLNTKNHSSGKEDRKLPLCSVGLHPWLIEGDGNRQFDTLEQIAADPQVVAIGEAGLDTLRGPSIEIQEQLLRKEILLSEQLGKPLILHIVRAWSPLLRLRRELAPLQPWILHGFRGKPELVKQLSSSGTNRFFFSIGEKFNPEAVAAIPADRLLVETDESLLPITEIIERVAKVRDIPPAELTRQIRTNLADIFSELPNRC